MGNLRAIRRVNNDDMKALKAFVVANKLDYYKQLYKNGTEVLIEEIFEKGYYKNALLSLEDGNIVAALIFADASEFKTTKEYIENYGNKHMGFFDKFKAKFSSLNMLPVHNGELYIELLGSSTEYNALISFAKVEGLMKKDITSLVTILGEGDRLEALANFTEATEVLLDPISKNNMKKYKLDIK